MLGLFLGLLLLHWIGDFVAQTKWMAENKSKKFEALAVHVFCYAGVLFAGLWVTQFWTVNDLCRFVLANLAAHMGVDLLTSRVGKEALRQRKMHHFFATVGADQMIHVATLMITSRYMLLPIY